ncbi:sugar-binding protein [Planctomicrobium sp. SH664]|uniref:sugar-binding protein n=1 Tax=Planctomicrobium sp. SH664 TaxID=3448125 RepID=UPI003F5B8822
MLTLPAGITSNAMYQQGYLDLYAFRAHYGLTDSASPTTTQMTNNVNGLNTAIEDAMNADLITFLSQGTYLVNNTVIGHQPSGEMGGPSLVGPNGAGVGSRPVIRLADNTFTSAFTSTNNLQPVVRFYNDEKTGVVGGADWGFDFQLRNITIDAGQGNTNALGLAMGSAQWSALENVNIIAGDGPGGYADAYAGMMGFPGASQTLNNLEVTGGKYGIYIGNPTPSSSTLFTSTRLIDQETSAIYRNLSASVYTFVGLEIVKDSGPVITMNNNTNFPSSTSMTLIDAKITVGGSPTSAIDNSAAESIYMRNVYVSGAANVIKSGSQAAVAASGTWTRVNEYAYADPENHANEWTPSENLAVDGRARIYNSNGSTITELAEIVNVDTNVAAPPSYLLSQHLIPDLPDFRNSAAVINVRAAPYNAAGDGVTNDQAAIQQAINDAANPLSPNYNKAVYLPKGTYLILSPITLQENTVFFGVANRETVLKAPDSSAWTGTGSTPYMLTTVNSATATTYMADITFNAPARQTYNAAWGMDPMDDPNRIPWLELVRWQAGKDSVVANLAESGQWQSTTFVPSDTVLAAGVSQMILITGNGGGRWFGGPTTIVGGSVRNDYAGLRVSGTSQALTFYGINIEHPPNPSLTPQTDQDDEVRELAIVNSSNVRVWNFKSESRGQTVVEVINSDNIWIEGVNGYGAGTTAALIEVRTDSSQVMATMTSMPAYVGMGGNWLLFEDRPTYGMPLQSNDFSMDLRDQLVRYQLNGAFDDTPFIPSSANTAPTISDITNKSTNEDTSTSAISFTIGDAETVASSLIVTVTSSNATLVPNNPTNLVLGGSGASRTLTINPASNQFGTSIITVTVSDGSLTTQDTFVLTVNSVNDAPTITDITNKTIYVNSSTGALAFTVGDVETAAGSLTVTATSSNTTLVPNNSANLVLGGSGVNRTLNVIPAAYQSGSSTITVTVSDGTTTSQDTFLITVNNGNVNIVQTASAPTIGGSVDGVWANAVSKDISTVINGTVTNSADLSGSFRTLWDSTYLYLLVEVTDDTRMVDSGATTQYDDSVEVFIDANKDAPGTGYGSTDYMYRFTWDGTSLTTQMFQAGVSQTVTGVTAAGVSTTGGSYFIEARITWAALGQSSIASGAQVGLDAAINDDDNGGTRDGKLSWFNSADTSWQHAINFATGILSPVVNTAPTITDITNKTMNQGTSTGAINFTIGDAQTSSSSLTVTASSSNATLVPNNSANLVLGGSGSSRTLNVIPVANQTGTSTITVTVSDGSLSTQDTFLLTVNPQGDLTIVRTSSAPTIGGSVDGVWANAVSKDISTVINGTVTNSADLSGSFRTLWDSTYLYLLVEVTDDTRMVDSGATTQYDDSVEVFIDANKDAPGTGYGSTDYMYRFTWDGTSLTTQMFQAGVSQTVTGVTAAGVSTTGGSYFIEARITWAALGQSSIASGAQVGLDAAINDDDNGGTRDGKLSWFNSADTSWQHAINFATAYLAAPQTAAGPELRNSRAPALKSSQLQPILLEAISRWQAAGQDVTVLAGVQIEISDLPGNLLGLSAGNKVYIDSNAAGYGWFIDPTPESDSEFTTGHASRRMDLLSVVSHELGHVLGIEEDGEQTEVMHEGLKVGERHVPEAVGSAATGIPPWWNRFFMESESPRGLLQKLRSCFGSLS